MKTKKKKSKGERQKILHQNLVAYSFLAPSLIGVICFSLIPLVISLYVSLTDWNFTQGIGNWNFVGLTNFKNLWTDEWFIASVKNTHRHGSHRTVSGDRDRGTDRRVLSQKGRRRGTSGNVYAAHL